MIKLDYTLTSPEERNKLVKQILEENPNPNEKYLEILTDYLIFAMEKEEKKEKKILTENRMTTVNKRETSFEGLVAQLENGEDGIYNLITENKQIIFQPKVTITKKDLEEIPFLKQLREAITTWEERLKRAEGKDAFIIKRALIEMRKDQYIIKNAYRKPIQLSNRMLYSKHYLSYEDTTHEFDEKGYPIPEGVSLLNPKICSIILCNYSKLKESSWDVLQGDLWHLLQDFDELAAAALEAYPLYESIVIYKIDGLQNIDIQEKIQLEFGIKHSLEYISSLWRNKIPKLIASKAEDQWLDYYFLNVEKGKYKRCSRCGQVKLAHNKYFSKNKTSKDGFYSICKECRNKKKRSGKGNGRKETLLL